MDSDNSNFEGGLESPKGRFGIVKGGSSESSHHSGIVTARGSGDGLVIRLDGRVDELSLRSALYDFVLSRKSFLSGNSLAFEWIGNEPSSDVVSDFSQMLADEFDILVTSSHLQNSFGKAKASHIESQFNDTKDDDMGLFGGIEGLSSMRDSSINANIGDFSDVKNDHQAIATAWDDPDARVVYATLRSGQRIETEHSLIVIGDVNSGAELIAGGDIMVLGTLRGVAHAGAYDETGGGRFIFALAMQPTQLRIGSVISRGTPEGGKAAEIARVDGSVIVVETFNARTALSKMKRF